MIVARKASTKHLGMILDEKLNFREHIKEALEKAKKGLALMKFLSKLVDRKTLVLTYIMHVRPHLEYGDIIFHGCAKSLMDCLERIQYQAGLIATKVYFLIMKWNDALYFGGNKENNAGIVEPPKYSVSFHFIINKQYLVAGKTLIRKNYTLSLDGSPCSKDVIFGVS